jgi:hypothetical protein
LHRSEGRGGGWLGAARDQPYCRCQRQIHQTGRLYGAGQSQSCDHEKAARQHADGGAQTVGEIEHGERCARRIRMAADEAAAHQRKGHAQQNGLRQDQRGAQTPLEPGGGKFGSQRRQDGVESRAGCGDEQRMERKRAGADDGFGKRIADEQVFPAPGETAAEPGTDGHAAHEYRQHQGLRIGGMPQEQLEVMAPDGFVDQPGEAGHGEQQEQRAARLELF